MSCNPTGPNALQFGKLLITIKPIQPVEKRVIGQQINKFSFTMSCFIRRQFSSFHSFHYLPPICWLCCACCVTRFNQILHQTTSTPTPHWLAPKIGVPTSLAGSPGAVHCDSVGVWRESVRGKFFAYIFWLSAYNLSILQLLFAKIKFVVASAKRQRPIVTGPVGSANGCACSPLRGTASITMQSSQWANTESGVSLHGW